MAERRMFNKTLLSGASFMALSRTARELYLYLNLHADDDGICGSARSVCRLCSCSKKHLQELIDSGWILDFEDGVVAITHWHIHNQIRRDRYRPSLYQSALAQLGNNSGTYYRLPEGCQPVAESVTLPTPQYSIAQSSINQININQHNPAVDQTAQADGSSSWLPGAAASVDIDIDAEADKIFRCYQMLCTDLVPCEKLTDPLKERIRYCYQSGYGFGMITGAFMRANQTPFLRGISRVGWKADLEWLLDPEHIQAVEAGKYESW